MAYDVHLRSQESASYWQSLTWQEFESAVAGLFSRIGYDVEHSGGAGDGGVDIRASNHESLLLLQCKKHSAPVGPAVVRELRGSGIQESGAIRILVSAAGFTASAAATAADCGTLLLDVDDLVLIQKHGSLRGYLANVIG